MNPRVKVKVLLFCSLFIAVLLAFFFNFFFSSQQPPLSERIISTAEEYLGTPYHFGAASGETTQFDCSSFVQYVYGRHGIGLPRTARAQAELGESVDLRELKKGDLLFYRSLSHPTQQGVGHVAIYTGSSTIVHARGGGVSYDDMTTPLFTSRFLLAKRVIDQK